MERGVGFSFLGGIFKNLILGDHSSLKCRLFPRIPYIACFSCMELLLIWQPEHLGKLSTLVLNGDCILFCNISCKQLKGVEVFFCQEMPIVFLNGYCDIPLMKGFSAHFRNKISEKHGNDF